MNRRSFIKILPAMAALGTWIKVRPQINPAWINAPYEAEFLFWRDFGQHICTKEECLSWHQLWD